MGSIGRLINQLEGTKKFKQNFGSQYVFQPGMTSLICPEKLLSVNNPDYLRCMLSDDKFTGITDLAPTTGNTIYKWGEKTVATIQNHTHMPVYLTFKYLSPRMILRGVDNASSALVDRATKTSVLYAATNQSCSTESAREQDFKFGSDVNRITYEGFLESAQHEFANQLIVGMQGIYDNQSSALSYGEGLGTLGTFNTPTTYDFVAGLVAGVDDVATAVLCVPIGISYNHSEYFRAMFKVYELKRIVLMPEQAHTFTLTDSSLMWIEEKPDTALSTANPDHHSIIDPWMKRNCWNKYTKMCAIEVNGSLIGADMFTSHTTNTTDGEIKDYAYALTQTDNTVDNVNILTPASTVSTHGGALRLYVQKEFYAGKLPNQDRDEFYFHFENDNKFIGQHDEPLTVRTDAAKV